MNRRAIACLSLSCSLIVAVSNLQAAESSRQRLLMDLGWKFNLGNADGAETPAFNDDAWRSVDLPHDYGIEGKVARNNPGGKATGYFPSGLGWYRRAFTAPQAWQGKRVAVEFGGIYMNADVWINGHHLGSHPYGYTTFSYDLTPYLKIGEKNVLAVRVDNTHFGNSRWYSGSGIYRHVWLTVTGPIHIAQWGTFVTTPEVSESEAQVVVETTVRNDSDAEQVVLLTTVIMDPDGKMASSPVPEAIRSVGAGGNSNIKLPAHSESTVKRTISVLRPKLWTPDPQAGAPPVLYKVISRIAIGTVVVDEYQTPFGMRTLKYSVDGGMQLNGKTIKLCGGCIHHDNGCLGAAAFDRAEQRRVELLKAAGYNAIRTAHNPPSEAFLDACDRLGMLVMDESFDCWEQGKNRYDYCVSFKAWWQRDMDAMLLRDRNHPSIVLWSVGNEIPGRDNANGLRICKMLADYVRTKDTTRGVTSAVNDRTNIDGYFANLDVGGYNYNLNNAASDHRRVPSRIIVCTESTPAAMFGYWRQINQGPYLIGDFVWTALDYFGESGIGGWNYSGDTAHYWHGAGSGELDSTCFPKPAAHYRNIVWDRGEKLYMSVREPDMPNRQIKTIDMWSLPPAWESWTWPGMEGKNLTVTIYSRYDKVRLYLNGKLVDEKPTTQNEQFRANFTLPYAPGTLKAVGVQADKEVGEIVFRTAGDAAKIRLTPDRAALHADRQDLSYVTVEVLDKEDRFQPNAGNLVKFSLSGPGEIVGMDNGDMRDEESYQGNQRKVWHGRGIVVIRSTSASGDIKLTASADGLAPATVSIQSLQGATAPVLP